MAQYIAKEKIVKEIERRLKTLTNTSPKDIRELAAIIGAQFYELMNLAQYIDTLEVKDFDLEKEIDNYLFPILSQDIKDKPYMYMAQCARYFFDLGLRVQKRK